MLHAATATGLDSEEEAEEETEEEEAEEEEATVLGVAVEEGADRGTARLLTPSNMGSSEFCRCGSTNRVFTLANVSGEYSVFYLRHATC
jgi:hypothetical protein